MKRILCIVGSMNAGGAETFLMKLYRNIDREKYQMDFCVAVKEPGVYDDEIRSYGGRILYTVPKSSGALKSFFTIKKIVEENKYEYVMRVSQHSLSGLELAAAKLGGARVTVFRSSNSQTGGGKVNRILHKIFLPITMFVPDIKFAPSTEAADFMFGKDSKEKRNAVILPNALDMNIYSYNEEARKKYRKELGIENNLVVGHIGRFTEQKNHKFLLEIFAEIKKHREDAVLLLIGKGEEEAKIKELTDKLSLTDSVKFLGVRQDVPQLLSAMDVFVFPSLYEGMPNTVIEAQATGLPCLIADTITREADITGLVKYMPLGDAALWAETALELVSDERKDTRGDFIKNGYDIQGSVDKFVKAVFGE